MGHVRKGARQTLNRNWQNGRLWWNDPDAVTLSGDMPAQEYRFHATAIVASGGMVLSGDDLSTLPADRLEMLKKMLPPSGVAAEFGGEGLRVGVVKLKGRTLVCLFNWGEGAERTAVEIPGAAAVTDLWSGRRYERVAGRVEVQLQGHEGTVLVGQ